MTDEKRPIGHGPYRGLVTFVTQVPFVHLKGGTLFLGHVPPA
jgi:hypothetical protein